MKRARGWESCNTNGFGKCKFDFATISELCLQCNLSSAPAHAIYKLILGGNSNRLASQTGLIAIARLDVTNGFPSIGFHSSLCADYAQAWTFIFF